MKRFITKNSFKRIIMLLLCLVVVGFTFTISGNKSVKEAGAAVNYCPNGDLIGNFGNGSGVAPSGWSFWNNGATTVRVYDDGDGNINDSANDGNYYIWMENSNNTRMYAAVTIPVNPGYMYDFYAETNSYGYYGDGGLLNIDFDGEITNKTRSGNAHYYRLDGREHLQVTEMVPGADCHVMVIYFWNSNYGDGYGTLYVDNVRVYCRNVNADVSATAVNNGVYGKTSPKVTCDWLCGNDTNDISRQWYYTDNSAIPGATSKDYSPGSTAFNAGQTLYCYCKITMRNSYSGWESVMQTNTVSVTMAKGTGSCTVSLASWTYGSPKSPSASSTTNNGAAVTYTYYNSSGTSLGSTRPSNVGSYSVTATFAAVTNYNACTSSKVSFTISKAAGAGTVTMSGWTYGGTVTNPSPSSNKNGTGNVTYTWYNSSKTALSGKPSSTSNAGTYYVKATFAATANYNAYTTDYVSFAISKATGAGTVTMSGWTYGGTVTNPSPSSNKNGTGNVTYTWYNSSKTALSGKPSSTSNAGTYYVRATFAATTNYNAYTTDYVSFAISRATGAGTVTMSGWTYGGTVTNPTPSSNKNGTGNVTYTWYNSSKTALSGKPSSTSNAGTYYVRATFAATTNYNAYTTDYVSFAISKAAGAGSVTIGGWTYGNTPSSPVPASSTNGTGSVSYTYYTNQSGTTMSAPNAQLAAGTYYVRATFAATTNYNAVTTGYVSFNVAKRAVTCTAASASKTYDAAALTANSASVSSSTPLVSGHTATYSVSGTQTLAGSSSNVLNSVVIKNSGGTDVSVNYNITRTNGTLTVNKRATTVTAGTQTWTYDGNAHTNSTCTATNLVSGQTATATMTAASTITNVGSVNNVINTVTIYSGSTDVTSSYTVTKANGTLTVSRSAINVPAAVTGLVYNGQTQTGVNGGAGYSLSGNTGIGANTYTATATPDGNHKWADGTTAAKSISWIISGKPVAFTAAGATKTYDAAALTNPTASINSGSTLVSGHTATFTVTGSRTDAGSTANVLSAVVIRDSGGNDVSSNYVITRNNGTLTVNKRATTVTAGTKTWTYDGNAHTNATCTATNLVSGQTATATMTAASTITNAGSVNNAVSTVKIYYGSTDVTANYAVTIVNGTLTVTRASITVPSAVTGLVYNGQTQTGVNGGTGYTLTGNSGINATSYSATAKVGSNYQWSDGTLTDKSIAWSIAKKSVSYTSASSQKVYDGQPLTNSNVSLSSGSLVSGHTVSSSVSGTITNAGTAQNSFTVIIRDSSSNNVTANYSITLTPGTLTVSKATATELTAVANLVYNGSSQNGVSGGNGCTLGGTRSAVNQGTYTATATPDSNHQWPDNTSSQRSVTWTISKRSVTVTAGTSSKMFDETPLTDATYTASGLVSGHSAAATMTAGSTITEMGSVPNVIASVVITDSSSNAVTDNYNISLVNGTLTITVNVDYVRENDFSDIDAAIDSLEDTPEISAANISDIRTSAEQICDMIEQAHNEWELWYGEENSAEIIARIEKVDKVLQTLRLLEGSVCQPKITSGKSVTPSEVTGTTEIGITQDGAFSGKYEFTVSNGDRDKEFYAAGQGFVTAYTTPITLNRAVSLSTGTFPVGTKLVYKSSNGYYYYKVEAPQVSSVPLTSFRKMADNTSFTEPTVNLVGANNTYTDTCVINADFTECETQLPAGAYQLNYTVTNNSDSNTATIGVYSAQTVNISPKRSFGVSVDSTPSTVTADGTTAVSGSYTVGSSTADDYLNSAKDRFVSVKMEILDSSDNPVALPGTAVTTGNSGISVNKRGNYFVLSGSGLLANGTGGNWSFNLNGAGASNRLKAGESYRVRATLCRKASADGALGETIAVSTGSSFTVTRPTINLTARLHKVNAVENSQCYRISSENNRVTIQLDYTNTVSSSTNAVITLEKKSGSTYSPVSDITGLINNTTQLLNSVDTPVASAVRNTGNITLTEIPVASCETSWIGIDMNDSALAQNDSYRFKLVMNNGSQTVTRYVYFVVSE